MKKKREGLRIHRNPVIEFNTIFGKLELHSPYLWIGGIGSKPLIDEMKIRHQGRSEAVIRALSDFGIEESFARAAARFKEHYHYDIGSSAVARSTKETAQQAVQYVEKRLSDFGQEQEQRKQLVEKILVELDGCEIRTARLMPIEDSEGKTPAYGNPKKSKEIKWRDVRVGFVRPLDSTSKLFVGRMDSYAQVVGQLHQAAVLTGMTPESKVIGVADGGIGLREELGKQFPTMQFILDKSHLKNHFYETAEKIGIRKKDRAKWVEPRIEDISNGDVGKIIEELKAAYEENPHKRLKRLIGYIERFYDALDYNTFKADGYPVGSGEIESAHKSIPQKRLKIPGASWHSDSIDPMLALRILRADDWWDDFWTERTQKALAA